MKITINRKIVGLFLAGIIVFAIFAGSTFLVIKSHQEALHRSNIITRKVNLTGDLQFQVNRLLLPVNRYLVTGDVRERDNFDSIIGEMSNIFAELKVFSGDKMWQAVAERVEKDAIDFGEKAIDILYIDNPVANKQAQGLMDGLTLLSESLIKETEGFHAFAEGEMKKMEEEVDRDTRKSNIYALIVLGALTSSALLLYYYLRRFVTDPIHQLHEGAGIIAKGELGHRLNIKTGDELEALASAFNNMAASLQEAKKELDRRIFELYTLYNISKVLSTTFVETEELLKEIVKKVSSNLGIKNVVIMLLDDKAGELYTAFGAEYLSEEKGKYAAAMRFKIGEGIYGRTAVSGEARLIKDVAQEKDVIPAEIPSPDIQSIIIVPFGARTKTLGLLCTYKNRPDAFGRDDMELLKAVAEHVALAIENARLYKETKMMAITDGLTGLYNHRFFIARLTEEIKRVDRYDRPLSLIIMDIDYFKHYNDRHGHQGGDEILRGVASLIIKTIRSADIAARYGGEEFVVILPETGKEQAVKMAERTRGVIENYPFQKRETQPGGRLTVSVGVATFKDDATNADELVKKADDALYRAKEGGRNRVEMA
jgi:diguanylate cyclase (GGDEF)-like protein